MKNSKKTLEFKIERTIPAPSDEVFDAWLNPKIPGNPWNAAEKFILDPKVDGLFYWTLQGDVPLRPIHGVRAARSNSAYLDVAKYPGTRVDRYPDLQETGPGHVDDPRAFQPSGS